MDWGGAGTAFVGTPRLAGRRDKHRKQYQHGCERLIASRAPPRQGPAPQGDLCGAGSRGKDVTAGDRGVCPPAGGTMSPHTPTARPRGAGGVEWGGTGETAPPLAGQRNT